MNIVFTDTMEIPTAYYPQPSSNLVPEWYKNIESYVGGVKKTNGEGITTGTIKRCMPVFDAITAGYIITTYVDISVSQRDGKPYYEWANSKPLGWHPVEQASNHPGRGSMADGGSYPKFINPWGIKTPKGYSTLFTQPMHRESPFTILDGIVDTDSYTAPVNFPFVLNDWNFEGLIPAGTPIAQVIPFKRESWQMEIGTEKDLKEQFAVTKYLRTSFFDSYKNKFRKPKEYK